MNVTAKRCLILLFLGMFICLAIISLDRPASAADDTVGISDVSVQIAAFQTNTSQITLTWGAVPPANGGTVSYEIDKSTDGGLTFVQAADVSTTTWTDDNGGNGVENYTNVIYRLRSIETVNGTPTPEPFGYPVNVYPPDTNTHDNYMNNTNLCNTCHSTHTAQASGLMTISDQTTVSEFCLTCHEGATNSKYDVINGSTKTSNGVCPSLGGVFGGTAVSAHKFDQTTLEAAPGLGGVNASQPMALGCTSCHSAHATGNYRMLNAQIEVPTAPDNLTLDPVSVVAGAATTSSSSGETSVYLSGAETLCQSCHGDYTTGTSHPVVASLGSLTTTLPLEGTAEDKANHTLKLTCITCHYSHGSPNDNLTVKPGNELCWQCHAPAQYGEPATPDNTSSGFSNSDQLNLHNFSEAGGHLVNCSTCHITHGNNVDGLLVGPNDSINAVDGAAGPGNWQYTSCTTKCHHQD